MTLKGTSEQQGGNFHYTWDFGDGSPLAKGTVDNKYAIEATHTYDKPVGTILTATLTVQDQRTGESASKQYFVEIFTKTLPIEVNLAIDEGLWYLHKSQTRIGAMGYWNVNGYYAETAASINAFEVVGHLESGDPSNPYTDTVSRGLRQLFAYLNVYSMTNQVLGDPDSNGNGYGLFVDQGNYIYQGGMVIDAIIASGTPTAKAATGIAPHVLGRTYQEIVQDMVDFYALAQYDSGPNGKVWGGWRYAIDDFPDNSACQWAAIGLIPAQHIFGCTVPDWIKQANTNWLAYSQMTNGVFGYTGPTMTSIGPFGTTPSGMVQLAMDGIGRGDPRWDKAETYMRDHFEDAATEGGYAQNLKEFYYGEIAFVKAMLLHDSNGDGIPEPIQFLHSTTPNVPDLDWYSAQAPPYGTDPTDGVARSLLKKQKPNHSWDGHSWTAATDGLATPWAIMMLQRTLFTAGAPVAVAKANPNPAATDQNVLLDGTASFHQDAKKHIVKWEWDVNNDGTFAAAGPFASTVFAAEGTYPIKLRVTDDASPAISTETTLNILVTKPPLPPTADAGGPYSFCPANKLFLDGTGSTNPDEGLSEAGRPGDTIIKYEWDLSGNGEFSDALGAQPDVTTFFANKPTGKYVIQLRVTDNTAESFPTSGRQDQSSVASTLVEVHGPNDSACECISDLKTFLKPRGGEVQLYWTGINSFQYNVYRGLISGGPYSRIASTTNIFSTYYDTDVKNGTTYFYVVRPANELDQEQCQSNEARGTPTKIKSIPTKPRRRAPGAG